MAKPHLAAVIEDRITGTKARLLRERGWGSVTISFPGYGSTDQARVLARILLTRKPNQAPAAADEAGSGVHYPADRLRRGWRAFFNTPAPGEPVTVILGEATIQTRADRSGIVDIAIPGHGLAPGWHTATIRTARGADTPAKVVIVAPDSDFGLVSDIDDTVIKTMLPRPMIAAWNTFVRHEGTRSAVPGMASMYRELLANHPGAPLVYVSTGAWNTVPQLTRFLRANGYPPGPLLMTDWGPTNTGWFRSGQEHKRACLHRLTRDLPSVRWVLVGDDGQHDPALYGEFAEQRPDAVRAIAIRRLSATEQMLSHFTPLAQDAVGTSRRRAPVPICYASDGYGLVRLLRTALTERGGTNDVVVEG